MNDETIDTLYDLLAHCTQQTARNQELLDRWRERPNVSPDAVKKTTELRDRWKRRRDAMFAVLEEQRCEPPPF